MKVRDLTVMALLGAVLYVGQVGMAFLPNIEVVSVLILVYTLTLGRKALFPVSAFILLEGTTFGFGLWWFTYLYIWYVWYLAVRLMRRNESVLMWAAAAGFYGLSFGALCAIPYLFAGGTGAALAWWTAGLFFDILHCAGNFVTTLILYRPLMRVMAYIKEALD
ncbi:MAG: hypothetical protein HFI38_10780 [Lachnospiraceae bacterium]|jgi:energy-coupling factor transport system substrate-specific component|nr:hypothetical protein [Lachnospiraceae bacterium]